MPDMVTLNEYELFLAGAALFCVLGFVAALIKIARNGK